MTRKTRLLMKAEVMLVRVEVFQDGVLSSTHLRLGTPLSSQTFTRLDAALKAFRVAARRQADAARLKLAA